MWLVCQMFNISFVWSDAFVYFVHTHNTLYIDRQIQYAAF